MAKPQKDLPPRTIKIGDLVNCGMYVGVVNGDQLSPGGIQGHLNVWLFLKKEPGTGPGFSVVVQRAHIKSEDLSVLDPHSKPILFDEIGKWMDIAEKQCECLIRAMPLEELSVQ